MNELAAMKDLLEDFLTEAGELLSDLDNKLVELEGRPDDKNLLNDIFRSFHTIKGGAGFLNVQALVQLCQRTENLFDKLRNNELAIDPVVMDAILAATGVVRDMFDSLEHGQMPEAADAGLLQTLDAINAGQRPAAAAPAAAPVATEPAAAMAPAGEPDWPVLHAALLDDDTATAGLALTPLAVPTAATASERAPATPPPPPAERAPNRAQPAAAAKETTIRVDINRLDMVLNLAGEIGLTKNRLNCLRSEILNGHRDVDTLKALDEAVSQLDLLVGDLQNAVMKTRMQPIGRLFQKFPRLVRDLARQLGKDVELEIIGEATEIDKTMIEDLNDPLVHLIRNALDHGVDTPAERQAAGKPVKGTIRLSAQQQGDHILIEIADDGRGMNPEAIREKALQKGLIDVQTANNLDERQSRNLIFLPGFSTKDTVSDISGRGVGMDVVKTNIQKLNGRIDVHSMPGQGSTFVIALPLTLAILPILIVRLGEQPFAIPLSMVREILVMHGEEIQEVSGQATMVLRDEVLPVRSLASLIGWPESETAPYGVLVQLAEHAFVLTIDSFIGQEDAVIKPLVDVKPHGVAGATMTGDGSIVLVLDIDALLLKPGAL